MRLKILEYAVEQGIQEGMEIGREEGMEASKKEITQINKLYIKEKKSPNEIAKNLNISLERVEAVLIELGYELDSVTDVDLIEEV